MRHALDARIEAILIVADTAVSVDMLADVLDAESAKIHERLQHLATEYLREERGFQLREIAGGWRFYSSPDYDEDVTRFVVDDHTAKLTPAALETLAIIAYRQPVTRSQIAAIRGVSVDGVLRNLLARDLVERRGETSTGAGLFVTTDTFLERMGLRSLDELAPLAPLLPDASEIPQLSTSLELS